MSIETEELKAHIIRRFKRRLHALGIVRIELITETSPDAPIAISPKQSPGRRLKKWISSSVLLRVFEITLLLSVMPTILPNFKVNYQKTYDRTVACIHSVQSHFDTSPTTTNPLPPLFPHTQEMAGTHHKSPAPISKDEPGVDLDLRRPRTRRRISMQQS